MRVGMLTPSISRLAGGPQNSVRELSRALSSLGVEVVIFTGRDQFTDRDIGSWAGLEVVTLYSYGPQSWRMLIGLSEKLISSRLDIVHIHGLWTSLSLASLRWRGVTGRPNVISPRGMLDSWALSNSGWKKAIALRTFEGKHLRTASLFHALCDQEERAIRTLGLSNKIVVVPNGAPTAGRKRSERKAEYKTLLYLGRLHPKKGLTILIRAWAKYIRGASNPWRLRIAGWDQGGHERELKRLAIELGCAADIEFVGPKFGEDKDEILSCADAFILPSFSEGLPMGVLEAWAYGLPVLMTAECNLPIGFQSGAAIEIPVDVDGLAQILMWELAKPEPFFIEMGVRGHLLVREKFEWATIGGSMRRAYQSLISAEPGH